MDLSLQRWIRVSLFNLMLVATLGVILRYKIAFALPFINQKHLLEGHSHFAFAGWVSQALMVLLVAYLASRTTNVILRKYRWLLLANLLTAYGMLVTFPIQGYGPVSISFSTLYIFVSYIFTVVYWRDLDKIKTRHVAHLWFKAALAFNVISSLGVFDLVWMMVNKVSHQNWYLAAEYFYLHFQYNGWFFFACMGLLMTRIVPIQVPELPLKRIFWVFAGSFLPAYFLSVLWMKMPLWLYVTIVIAAFAQVFCWINLLLLLKKKGPILKEHLTNTGLWVMRLSAIALSIKLLLQLGSVIPALSDLSYGFRPIIIGYLHLVLLGVITLFLIGFMIADRYLMISRLSLTGLLIFISGIILNEIFLMVQGVKALSYNSIPFINEILFGAALVLFSGMAVLNISQQRKSRQAK